MAAHEWPQHRELLVAPNRAYVEPVQNHKPAPALQPFRGLLSINLYGREQASLRGIVTSRVVRCTYVEVSYQCNGEAVHTYIYDTALFDCSATHNVFFACICFHLAGAQSKLRRVQCPLEFNMRSEVVNCVKQCCPRQTIGGTVNKITSTAKTTRALGVVVGSQRRHHCPCMHCMQMHAFAGVRSQPHYCWRPLAASLLR